MRASTRSTGKGRNCLAIASVLVWGSVMAACGNDSVVLSEEELLDMGDLPVAATSSSTGHGTGNLLELDGCTSFELTELQHHVYVEFATRDVPTLGEVIYADEPEAVAAAYNDAVAQLTDCLASPEGPVGLESAWAPYAKRIELPDTAGDAFAVMSGLYAMPAESHPDYERYFDLQYISDLYDDGNQAPFCRHAIGIVKHDDRLVIVTANGGAQVHDLIKAGTFASILETATSQLAS